MKYKLKQGKSVEDMPTFSKLLKSIKSSLSKNDAVELDIVPKAANEFLEEVVASSPNKVKKETSKKYEGDE